MSSPKPDAARSAGKAGAGARIAAQAVAMATSGGSGRLAPSAVDLARRHCDALMFSVALGGVTPEQVGALRLDLPAGRPLDGAASWLGRRLVGLRRRLR
jgi:hypothetical protein